MEKVIVVMGPTASGKTAVSVELAKIINGEIISADSMQIYRGLDIGTAKVTSEEAQGIPHHLINIVEPDQLFSVADYKEKALETILDILERGKQPIICGGTGLYIDALIRNIDFSDATDVDFGLRKELADYAKTNGKEKLHHMLMELDPESAKWIHPNNVKRVIRAIEVCKKTGKPFSEYRGDSISNPAEYDFLLFYLVHDRQFLYERINKRVDKMFEDGLLGETKGLYEKGLMGTASQAIGYKEIIPYLKNEVTLNEAKEKLMQETRRYAKRQMTWFRRYPQANLIEMKGKNPQEVALIISQNLFPNGQ